MKQIKVFFISMIFILSACGRQTITSTQVQGIDTGDPALNSVIESYFSNFNDINKWSEFATDDFIKRVYFWCSGDNSDTKTLEEMKATYYEINEQSLKLKSYEVNDFEKQNDDSVVIHVSRKWEDGSVDESSYSIIRIKDSWKIDNRI